MTTVETVRGPVEVAKLGRTLMHEHVFVMQPEALQNFGQVWGEDWDEDERVADAVEKLRAVRSAVLRALTLRRAVEPLAVQRCICRIRSRRFECASN